MKRKKAKIKPIPDEYLGEIPEGARELIERGDGDPRWSFSADRVRGEWWIIGWRSCGNSGYPLFPIRADWTRLDYIRAEHDLISSDEWDRMEWVYTRMQATPDFAVDWSG